MLTDEIRARMIEAMKARDDRTKAILRVALGEIQTTETGSGEKLDDAGVEKILRKLVKSNEETLAATETLQAAETLQTTVRDDQKEVLAHELRVLKAFLPQTLTREEIVEALGEVAEAVRAAKSDGQATGVAMKHLRAAGASVTGQDVAAVVREMRA